MCCLRMMDQIVWSVIQEKITGDAELGIVKSVVALAAKGHLSVMQVKDSKALFPKSFVGSSYCAS